MNKVLLYGFGGHGQVLATALSAQQQLAGFFDKALPQDWRGVVPYLGQYDPMVLPEFPLVVAIGDNATRQKVASEVVHNFGQIISPNAFCAFDVIVGEGTVVLQMAAVQARVKIGNHVIVNAGAVIDHDAVIDDFVHIGPGAVVASLSSIGKGAFIGAGAVIPSRSIVPAGEVVPAGTVFRARN